MQCVLVMVDKDDWMGWVDFFQECFECCGYVVIGQCQCLFVVGGVCQECVECCLVVVWCLDVVGGVECVCLVVQEQVGVGVGFGIVDWGVLMGVGDV